MKNPYPRYSYCLLLCLQAVANGAEIPKLTNNVALNLPGAWSTNSVPGTGDVMLWDSQFAASATAGLSPIGGDMSVAGIKVTNVAGVANPTNLLCGFVNPTSANTLTIGASGIDMSAATQAILMQSKITIGADQTWNIANANTATSPAGFNNNEDLAIQSLTPAAAFNLNGKTVTTTGGGYVTISSGWVISNGTINTGNNLFVLQGGGSQLMNIQNTVNLIVSSGRLRIGSQSGTGGASMNSAANITVHNTGTVEFRSNNSPSLTQSGPITLNQGSGLSYLVDNTAPIVLSGAIDVAGSTLLRVAGGGNPGTLPVFSGGLTGAGAINFQNTATAAGGILRFTGNNSGYTGTLTMSATTGNRSLRLGSANAGSASATWDIGPGNFLQSEGLAVSLGTLNGSGTVTNSHASNLATFSIGAGNFAGAITNGAASTTAVTKVGPGTLVLSGANTYSGTTTVSQGILVDTPDHTGAGAVSIADGATFATMVKAADTTLSIGNLEVGTTTGGTVQLDFGVHPNPTSAPLAANNLFFHGPSTIKVSGKNLTAGTFPLLQYTTKDGGSTAVAGLTLALPTRTTGVLQDDGTLISLNLTGTEQVKWNGDVSNDWDIDPDGTGAVGTPNWLTTSGNVATRYIQGSVGTDAVNFDDSASGGTEKTVNLTATVTPTGLTFDNSTKNYTLTGSGKLSGLVGLEKKGTGMVTLANTTANDYAGGTVITAGSLRLGDGVTAGAGQITGAIQNDGTLILNRPDDFDFPYTLTGTGTLEKAGPNTVSFTQAANFTSPVTLTAGKLKFNAGGTLSGILSGPGELENAAGTLLINGENPNTNTGNVTVSGGSLQLAKGAGVNAVGGDIYLTGGATLVILANEQIPDTATLHVLGTSADSLPAAGTGTETYANVVVNGVATTQLIMRNMHTITGTGTVTAGILGVASSHTGSVGGVVMTAPTAMLRVAGSGGPSVLNIGAGGITAAAGEIQVKFNANDQDATLNLAGDLTTTGNLAVTNANYGGPNLNIVNLTGNRVFNIGAGTTTTFAPDLASAGGDTLTKTGDGTLTLNASSAANIGGGTTVNAGTLLVNGSIAGGLTVNAAGTLGGSGSLSGNTTVAGGTLAPGTDIGALTSSGTVTFGPDSDLAIGVGSWTGTTAGTDWDLINANTLEFTATPANPLTIHVSGTPTGFTETGKTLVIGTSVSAITGFDASAVLIDPSGFSGSGTWAVQLNGNNVELVYTASALPPYDAWASNAGLTEANNDPADDPDSDGQDNQLEFALAGNPLSGAANDKVVSKIASVGGQMALTLTLPVRSEVSFGGSPSKNGAADGIVYTVEATDEIDDWQVEVTEVTGADATAIQAGLPALPSGWTYKTFRTAGAVTGDPKEFIRVVVNTAA